MSYKKLILIFSIFIINSCTNAPVFKEKEALNSSQKREFLDILKKDKYLSICNLNREYQELLKSDSNNSRLLKKLLISYTQNLANGCIDLKSFEDSQKRRKKEEIDSVYNVDIQRVDRAKISKLLDLNSSIESILKPYIPPYPTFKALVNRYNLLKAKKSTSKKLLYKLRLNIERVKLLPHKLEKSYITINIPEFNLRLVEENQTKLLFGVVVGKYKKQTPIFSSKLSYIVVNPTWNIPDSIARKSIIPKMLRSRKYLSRKGIVIRKSYDLNSKKIKRADVKWKKYLKKRGYIPYKFIQKPSKRNGLGRVKFIFPNRYAVYMHDTTGKFRFKSKRKSMRVNSSGCIRLEKPLTMLRYITSKYTKQSIKSVTKRYKSLKSYNLSLSKKLQVHTLYLTAFIDDCGVLRLSDDIYGFDKSQKLNFKL